MKLSKTMRGASLLAALSLVAAACGSDDNDAASTTAPAATTTPATEPMPRADEPEPMSSDR